MESGRDDFGGGSVGLGTMTSVFCSFGGMVGGSAKMKPSSAGLTLLLLLSSGDVLKVRVLAVQRFMADLNALKGDLCALIGTLCGAPSPPNKKIGGKKL